MRRRLLYRLFLVLTITPAFAYAQGAESSGFAGAVVDLFAQFGNAIDRMVVSDGSQFVQVANGWLDDFGPVALFFLIFRYFRSGRGEAMGWLLEYAFGYLTAKFLLLCYSTPTFLLGGSSVSHFFMDAFKGLANQVDVTRLETVTQTIANITGGVKPPSLFSPLKAIPYVGVLLNSIFLEIIVWLVTLAGLLGYGIGAAIGPLFIPWFVFPVTRIVTVRWINFMLLNAAYRLVGALYVQIFSNVLVFWYGTIFGPNMSLSHFMVLMVPTMAITLIMFVLVFFVFHWTHDLFSGSASAAMAGAGATMTALRIFI
jgi:hypothetical protein